MQMVQCIHLGCKHSTYTLHTLGAQKHISQQTSSMHHLSKRNIQYRPQQGTAALLLGSCITSHSTKYCTARHVLQAQQGRLGLVQVQRKSVVTRATHKPDIRSHVVGSPLAHHGSKGTQTTCHKRTTRLLNTQKTCSAKTLAHNYLAHMLGASQPTQSRLDSIQGVRSASQTSHSTLRNATCKAAQSLVGSGRWQEVHSQKTVHHIWTLLEYTSRAPYVTLANLNQLTSKMQARQTCSHHT